MKISHLVLLTAGSATVVFAQAGGGSQLGPDPVEWTENEQGIPVTDRLTVQKCGSCHRPDDQGNLSRISWIRATPEGWSQTIKRMVNLHGLSISPEEARGVVRYLGSQHGLAPEEAKDVMYIVERRIITEANIPDADVRQACSSCHAFGQVLSSRRSRREWALLQNMHVALYSQAEAQFNAPIASTQGNESRGTDEPASRRPTRRDAALEWLSENAKLQTAEWADWRPRISTPQLTGTWVVSAFLPGRGRYIGEMNITPAADPAQFTTTTTLRSLDTGETMTRQGTGLVYGGYSWRGGSTASTGAGNQPDDPNHALREAMWFSPGQGTAQGRWYWGEYHEFGFDVSLTRASDRPAIAAVSPGALKAGSTGQSVHIYGVNLPTGLQPRDLDLGAGVTVTGITSANAQEIVATVNVAGEAVPGLRDVGVRGTTLVKALPVYDRVDFLKISPDTSIARLGGIKYAKGYSQFVATGYANGPDGKPDTPDDVPIGPIEADWRIDEFPTVTYDDDKRFVGTMGTNALFTPASEGPNPERRFSRNNYGEVWVVATAKNEKDELGQPLTGRSYLVVTVPTYRRWDQPEVSQ